jgi:hypothetical protein
MSCLQIRSFPISLNNLGSVCCAASRSYGSLEDALVGCGQKRGPGFYPAPTFEATSAEELGDDDGGGDDSMSPHVESKKRRLTFDQVRSLNKNFELENKLEPERKMQLAKELGLQPRQVAVWFQNRRARWKTKQLERDYEVLSLEYNRLKTELEAVVEERQELQAKVQWLTGKVHPDQAELSAGCRDPAAGDVSGARKVMESTAPAALQHPHPSSTSRDEITQMNLLPHESKAEQQARSFPTTREGLPSSTTARNNRKLADGSPSSVSCTSSEILDADSPRTIESGFSLSQAQEYSKTVDAASCTPQLICAVDTIRAAADHHPAPTTARDVIMDHLTEEFCGGSRVFSPRTATAAYNPRATAVKLEPELLMGTSASVVSFQADQDSCNYLLSQVDEHAGALEPWWDWA